MPEEVVLPIALLRALGPVLTPELAATGLDVEVLDPVAATGTPPPYLLDEHGTLKEKVAEHLESIRKHYVVPALILRFDWAGRTERGLDRFIDNTEVVLLDAAGERMLGVGYVNGRGDAVFPPGPEFDATSAVQLRFSLPKASRPKKRVARSSAPAHEQLLASGWLAGRMRPAEPAPVQLPSDYLAVVAEWGEASLFGELYWHGPAFIFDSELPEVGRDPWLVSRRGRDLYPAPGGLLPWGGDGSGMTCFWLTDGEPDAWEVVLHEHEDAYAVRTGMTFAQLLLLVADGEFEAREEMMLVHPSADPDDVHFAPWTLGPISDADPAAYAPAPPWEPGQKFPIVPRP